MFQLPRVYTDFFQHTVDQLACSPSLEIASRLRGSLHLAQHQLLQITATVNDFWEITDVDNEPDDIRILDAPFVQQNELLNSSPVDVEDDLNALTRASPTGRTVEKSRRVLVLITQCNEAGKMSSLATEFFKPTTRLMTVFGELPWLTAADRYRFGDIVDCLYFIFYEGAGKDNLRFLDTNGGPLSSAECDLIWCIKHLRNKWSRHDADHGKEKDIQKSWEELAAKLRWLGLAEHPTEPQHFQRLHYKLLESAEAFLQCILSKLMLKN